MPISEQFVSQLMDVCGANLSEIRRKVMIEQIIRVARMGFEKTEHQEAFAYLICIESKFDSSAKSKAGALGLTQIMPKFAQSFADSCNLGKVDTADLVYPDVSLTIGSCHFGDLLNQYEGRVALALAAYNSGFESTTVKKIAKMQSGGHPETVQYVASYTVLKEKMQARSAP